MQMEHMRRECGCYPDPTTPEDEHAAFLWGAPHEGRIRHDVGPVQVKPFFIDEAEAGMSRQACVRALRAEGVATSAFSYRLQHKCPLYTESQWWHHPPVTTELPGSELANATAIPLPYFTSEVPELVDQYVKAFEKVWAHRRELT